MTIRTGLFASLVLIAIAGCATPQSEVQTSGLNSTSEPSQQLVAGNFRGNVYLWKYVGRNPYGGTLEWALAQSGWPKEVQVALIKLWSGPHARAVFSTGQWFDWMSEGGKRKGTKPAVHHNVLTEWPPQQHEAADAVSFLSRRVTYTLVKVHKCGNFGGFKDVPSVTIPPGPVYGMIPEVECPPEQQINCCS